MCTRHRFRKENATRIVTEGLPFDDFKNDRLQALRWQTLAPIGISATIRGAPSIEEPQLTSKLVLLAVKQDRFDESGLMVLAARITCDLSLITSIDELAELVSSSSEELDDDVDDELSPSESECGACDVLGASGV